MSTVQANTPYVSQDLLTAVNAKKPAATDASSVSADTDKFMTLLVTQLKNQDPLNPLDNAQLTSQLAQLSTVTGVNKLNATLESLKASYQSSESLQAANMIGRGVLVEGNNVALSSGKAILGVSLATPADSVQVVITDPRTGKDVQTIELGAQQAGTLPLTWNGMPDGSATAMADGNYGFRVVARRGTDVLADAKALTFQSVLSVSTSVADGVKLNLTNNSAVAMTDVRQIL